MKETKYEEAWETIKKGFKLLAQSVGASISNHPAVSTLIALLVVSIGFNIIIGLSYMNSQYENNTDSLKIIQLEQKNDSLRGANIRYTK